MKRCHVITLGSIGYGEAWVLQDRLVAARKRGDAPDVLLLCEHPHVITLGRSGKIEHLHAPDDVLRDLRVEFHRSNRGGDITYHGPGQLVGYPILQLGDIRRDVVWYVRMLEEAMIRASAAFGIQAFRIPGCTGAWVRTAEADTAAGEAAACGSAPQALTESQPGTRDDKLGAIGVHLSRWVTSHGFAFNVATDLRYFDLIVPCGIVGRGTTSVSKLIGRPVAWDEAATRIIEGFGEAFQFEMVPGTREQLDAWVAAPVAAAAGAAQP